MANPNIEVEVIAKVDGVTQGVAQATSQLDKLGKSAAATAPQVQKLTQATAGYNSIGTDFARIIQDAPFGIIGVSNNVTQLAGSFQVLKNQTGSSGAAFKAALGSILSSGNALVLGISILTSAFTFLQMKGFFKTEESAKSLADQLEQYRQTLDAVTKASIEGQANAAKEIQSFALLRAQAENTNISFQKRIDAVNELRKQYPDYLKNLTDEQILTGNVGDAYNKLTAGLIATAKARAASDQIAKNSLDVLTLTTQEEERALKIKELQIEKSKTLAEADRQTARDRFDYILKAEAIQGNINDLEAENLKSKEERNRIAQSELKLTELINQSVSNGAIFTKNRTAETQKNVDEVQKLKRTFEEIQNIEFNLPKVSFEATAPILPGVDLSNTQAQIKSLQTLNNALEGTGLTVEQFYAAIANGAAEGFDSLDTFIGRLADTQVLVQNTFGILQANITEAFSDLGASLGEALATGGNVLSTVGKSLLGSVGKLLGDFGKQLIAFGVAGLAYSKLIKSLFTDPLTAAPKAGLAIAAGVALVALSGAISSGLKSNAGGGGGGGGASVGGAGVGGGSSFVGGAQGGLFQQNRDVSGEFVVRGQDLVYVLGQANNRINKG